MKYKNIRNALVASLLVSSGLVQAETVTIEHTFTANTPAVAAQVNANFNGVKTAVDDNDTRIDDLLAAVSQLQADLTAANSQINSLTTSLAAANADIDALESNSVLELDGYLMLSSFNGYDTAEFSGVNVQINDGTGPNLSPVNGLGNLTIGYNTTSPSAQEFCSNPNYLNETDCSTINGHDWLQNERTGSHNLILGTQNSYTSRGGIVAGQNNVINSIYSSVVGGRENRVDTEWSVIVSGLNNVIRPNLTTGPYSSILGGYQNVVFGTYSTISGGRSNTATSFYSSVSGGQSNEASGEYSTVSGGLLRNSTGTHDWRAGGLFETN